MSTVQRQASLGTQSSRLLILNTARARKQSGRLRTQEHVPILDKAATE